MPVYDPLVPTGLLNLDVDYKNLQGNFQQANTVYGTDHYAFDNATSNQGFHQKVTTPASGSVPVTVANPVLYSFQQYANLGVLQYSKGVTPGPSTVPTAITNLNSTDAPISLGNGGTADVLNFAGMTAAMCTAFAVDATPGAGRGSQAVVIWDGTNLWLTNNVIHFLGLAFVISGSILRVINQSGITLNNIYWNLQINRVK